jgi:predicted phosphoribosyltransferase
MFLNRIDAGQQLAKKLKEYQHEQGVILAVPRGGVAVAYEVAKELEWPMDLILIKKLGHPKHKEYAIGAVSLSDRIVIPHADVSDEYIESETKQVRERLMEMRQKFMGNKPLVDVKGKTAIVVDDGIATGNTIYAAVELLRKQNPRKIIVASPVAPQSTVSKLMMEADELIVLDIPEEFIGVGRFYEDFTQVTDEEVIHDLQKLEVNS